MICFYVPLSVSKEMDFTTGHSFFLIFSRGLKQLEDPGEKQPVLGPFLLASPLEN